MTVLDIRRLLNAQGRMPARSSTICCSGVSAHTFIAFDALKIDGKD
jgi:hypothetical protein